MSTIVLDRVAAVAPEPPALPVGVGASDATEDCIEGPAAGSAAAVAAAAARMPWFDGSAGFSSGVTGCKMGVPLPEGRWTIFPACIAAIAGVGEEEEEGVSTDGREMPTSYKYAHDRAFVLRKKFQTPSPQANWTE